MVLSVPFKLHLDNFYFKNLGNLPSDRKDKKIPLNISGRLLPLFPPPPLRRFMLMCKVAVAEFTRWRRIALVGFYTTDCLSKYDQQWNLTTAIWRAATHESVIWTQVHSYRIRNWCKMKGIPESKFARHSLQLNRNWSRFHSGTKNEILQTVIMVSLLLMKRQLDRKDLRCITRQGGCTSLCRKSMKGLNTLS